MTLRRAALRCNAKEQNEIVVYLYIYKYIYIYRVSQEERT